LQVELAEWFDLPGQRPPATRSFPAGPTCSARPEC